MVNRSEHIKERASKLVDEKGYTTLVKDENSFSLILRRLGLGRREYIIEAPLNEPYKHRAQHSGRYRNHLDALLAAEDEFHQDETKNYLIDDVCKLSLLEQIATQTGYCLQLMKSEGQECNVWTRESVKTNGKESMGSWTEKRIKLDADKLAVSIKRPYTPGTHIPFWEAYDSLVRSHTEQKD